MLFFESIDSLLTNHYSHDNLPAHIDLCSGNGLVPAHFILNGKTQAFWAVDFYPHFATDLKLYINDTKHVSCAISDTDRTHFNQNGHFIIFDVLHTQPRSFPRLDTSKKTDIIVSANPPWEPMPSFIVKSLFNRSVHKYLKDAPVRSTRTVAMTAKDPSLKKFASFCSQNNLDITIIPQICGGIDGLIFYPHVFNFAAHLNAQYLSINISTLSDSEKFITLLRSYPYKIEKINFVETLAYGYDSTKLARGHFHSVVQNNVLRYDDKGDLRYLLCNITLQYNDRHTSSNTNGELYRELLEAYKIAAEKNTLNPINKLIEKKSAQYSRWFLSRSDIKRMRASNR